MLIRYYQSNDYDNTVLRKFLENESHVIAHTNTITIRAAGGSAKPRYASTYDTKNDLLRKFLENQSAALAGRMTMHLR